MNNAVNSNYYVSTGTSSSPAVIGVSVQQSVFFDQDLPPLDLLYSLVDLYFKHVNTWCPILDRQSTFDKLFGHSLLDDADRILLHAMVAIALRFCADARVTPDLRKQYHDTSKQKVQLYGLENSNVRALQALAILALDVTGTSNGPPGWNLLAVIVRSVIQLGLAVETTSTLVSPIYPSIATLRALVLPDTKTWIEDEERRRLFWMVYLLDRYATIATAFEFTLNEKEIDRRLPCRDDFFSNNQPVETRWFRRLERSDHSMDRPENLGSFSYHCEILGILSRIHQFLKRPIDIGSRRDVEQWQSSYKKLDSELTSWHFSLPSEHSSVSRLFPSSLSDDNVGWVMLHAAFHTTVVRLHSSAAYPTVRSSIFTPSYSAMQRCLGAVEKLSEIGRYAVTNEILDKLGPPFAFYLWVSARLLLVHGSTMEHELNPNIAFFISTLAEMGQYWEVAQRYAEILNRVLEEHQQSVGTNGERVTPSTVKILADMRRQVISNF